MLQWWKSDFSSYTLPSTLVSPSASISFSISSPVELFLCTNKKHHWCCERGQWQCVRFCVAGIGILYEWGICSALDNKIGLKYVYFRAVLHREETVRSWALFLQHCDANQTGKGGCAQTWTPVAQGDISYIPWVTCLIWKELLKHRERKMGGLEGRWELWGSQTR